jgi:hypothetical protein
MGDAFIGQRFVDVTGVPPVLAPERITSHYRQIYRIASLSLRDTDGVGDVGLANALRSDGSPGVGDSEFRHEYEVWTGVSYNAAANLYHWGKHNRDGAMQAAALMIGWGVYRQTWVDEATAYWFSTPEAWQIDDPVPRPHVPARTRDLGTIDGGSRPSYNYLLGSRVKPLAASALRPRRCMGSMAGTKGALRCPGGTVRCAAVP